MATTGFAVAARMALTLLIVHIMRPAASSACGAGVADRSASYVPSFAPSRRRGAVGHRGCEMGQRVEPGRDPGRERGEQDRLGDLLRRRAAASGAGHVE